MRRSTGKLCFTWYRTSITIPEKVGNFETTGATVVFEVVVDDYAEVWADGKLPRVLGQTGGALVKGFNAPNRVVLTSGARPDQKIQLALLGVNGPLSDPPPNFIWIRSATLKFFAPGALSGSTTLAQVTRLDPADPLCMGESGARRGTVQRPVADHEQVTRRVQVSGSRPSRRGRAPGRTRGRD